MHATVRRYEGVDQGRTDELIKDRRHAANFREQAEFPLRRDLAQRDELDRQILDLQEQLSNAATSQFGSGWAWLTVSNGKLGVAGRPNQDSPLIDNTIPILGLDVWEHAYYLKYQNRRAEYVTAWWNVVNWEEVGRRYEAAL